MERSLRKFFDFYEELNVAELLQHIWSFTDITSKFVFIDQSKTRISVTLDLLKKKWSKDLIALETVDAKKCFLKPKRQF